MSTFRWVGLPSSSIVSEPRRPGRVPSSTTVTPGDATRWPRRPENAELPLRLKSPSRPWPTASCRSTPGQPGPSTTVIVPAGAGRASRLTSACDTACRAYSSSTASGKVGWGGAPPPAAGAALAPSVRFRDHLHRQADQRADVGGERAVGARDEHHLVLAAEARDALRDARVERAALALEPLEQRHLLRRIERGHRVERAVQRNRNRSLPGPGLPALSS